MKQEIKDKFIKQGYRFTGEESAIKPCEWCKRSIRGDGECYKYSFYNIKSWQCIQASLDVINCTHKCKFCWRNLESTTASEITTDDDPKQIIENSIIEHVKLLQGFGGTDQKDEVRYQEAQKPKHLTLSLAGEALLYPKVGEVIDYVKSKNMTCFIVTNGTLPNRLRTLLDHQPTQLYITLPSYNEENYVKTCQPLLADGWKRINESLQMLKEFSCRKAVRLTVVKGLNMEHPEKYAEILKDVDADFIEVKAYVWVGESRERLDLSAMPNMDEIREFSDKIVKSAGLVKVDEREESRVVLLMKKDNRYFEKEKRYFKN